MNNYYAAGFPQVAQWCHNLPASTGDTRYVGLIPGSGRSSGGGMATRLAFLPGESCGQSSLGGYSPWGSREPGTTE